MIRSAVTVSLVAEARRGPFVFSNGIADGAKRAAALGFDAIELFPPSAEAIDQRELREALDRYQLKLAAIGTGAGWLINRWHLCHSNAQTRGRARDFIRAIIEVAASFDAPAILGSMQGRAEDDVSRERACDWVRDAVMEFGELAARHAQCFLYEPLNRYETNVFNRIEETCAFLRSFSNGTVKVLADLFHMNIEEVSIPAALRLAGSLLGHVHFADSNRQAAGFGHTEMLPILETLRAMEYRGYLSAEVFPLPDADTAAGQTIATIKQFARFENQVARNA